MFRYTITPLLLETLKKITREILELNRQAFSNLVLHELEVEANAQSAFSSTSIEGNPLPLTDVKKLLKTQPHRIRNTEREVLNYNKALVWIKGELASKNFSFDKDFVLSTHKKVMSDLLLKSKVGRYRSEPVFVNDPRLKKTVFWPPDHQDVSRLMSELVEFISENKHKLDPIILAGLFHKQFVIIHPFIDGNGRTVRLTTKAILADLGIDTFHLFSFENYYNQNVTTYFQNVGAQGNYYDVFKKINFTEWLEYFAAGILDELLRVRKILENESRKNHPEDRLSTDQKNIIEFIKRNGFIQDKDYAKITQRAKATRALDFKKLVSLEIIERKGQGPSTFYVLKN